MYLYINIYIFNKQEDKQILACECPYKHIHRFIVVPVLSNYELSDTVLAESRPAERIYWTPV